MLDQSLVFDNETLSFRMTQRFTNLPLRRSGVIIRDDYKELLKDFIPRLFSVLTKYEDQIDSININGYASSFYKKEWSSDTIYKQNLQASKLRANTIFDFMKKISEDSNILSLCNTQGFSNNDPIYAQNGTEDLNMSKRVEFQIVLK